MKYDLVELVRMSSLIAVVTPANPPGYEKHIAFQDEWDDLSDDLKSMPLSNPDIPPYEQFVHCFVIKDVIFGDRKLNDQIEVISSNDGICQSAHFNYYALGMNMSIDYDRYSPKYAVDEQGQQIIFVRAWHGNRTSDTPFPFESPENTQSIEFYEFIADNGREGLEARTEVERLIKEQGWKISVEEWDDPFDGPSPVSG